jgi:pimeloyl-ACP methyl ester carboxylesterase
MRVVVDEIGSFFVGGQTVAVRDLDPVEARFTPHSRAIKIEQNGDFDAFQMYVQYVKVADGDGGPLLLWHGGGLTGSIWERTPDERPGWQSHFLEAGYDVYISDAVERGRSSWARHPQIYSSPPVFRSKGEAWSLFRIGPREAYDAPNRCGFSSSQFPVSAFDQFTKALVPRWLTNDAQTQEAYDALLLRLGPCTIVAHSQGAMFALNAALRAPHLVRAVVAIEPSEVPQVEGDALAALRDVPHLFLWGDYIDEHALWREAYANAQTYGDALRRAGVPSERLVLPENGLAGNSHFLMLDRNSDHVARFVRGWLEQHAAQAV